MISSFCDIDAYVMGTASVGTGGLSGIGNPPIPITESRRESIFRECSEGHASNKARFGLKNNLSWRGARF